MLVSIKYIILDVCLPLTLSQVLTKEYVDFLRSVRTALPNLIALLVSFLWIHVTSTTKPLCSVERACSCTTDIQNHRYEEATDNPQEQSTNHGYFITNVRVGRKESRFEACRMLSKSVQYAFVERSLMWRNLALFPLRSYCKLISQVPV